RAQLGRRGGGGRRRGRGLAGGRRGRGRRGVLVVVSCRVLAAGGGCRWPAPVRVVVAGQPVGELAHPGGLQGGAHRLDRVPHGEARSRFGPSGCCSARATRASALTSIASTSVATITTRARPAGWMPATRSESAVRGGRRAARLAGSSPRSGRSSRSASRARS